MFLSFMAQRCLITSVIVCSYLNDPSYFKFEFRLDLGFRLNLEFRAHYCQGWNANNGGR